MGSHPATDVYAAPRTSSPSNIIIMRGLRDDSVDGSWATRRSGCPGVPGVLGVGEPKPVVVLDWTILPARERLPIVTHPNDAPTHVSGTT